MNFRIFVFYFIFTTVKHTRAWQVEVDFIEDEHQQGSGHIDVHSYKQQSGHDEKHHYVNTIAEPTTIEVQYNTGAIRHKREDGVNIEEEEPIVTTFARDNSHTDDVIYVDADGSHGQHNVTVVHENGKGTLRTHDVIIVDDTEVPLDLESPDTAIMIVIDGEYDYDGPESNKGNEIVVVIDNATSSDNTKATTPSTRTFRTSSSQPAMTVRVTTVSGVSATTAPSRITTAFQLPSSTIRTLPSVTSTRPPKTSRIVATVSSTSPATYPPTSSTTSTLPPTTSTLLPKTSTRPPTTPTRPPTTSTLPPTTSTRPPTTSTRPPTTSTLPPITSTRPPTTSTLPPTTSTLPPATSTRPPTTSTRPPTTSTYSPITSTSTLPPKTSTRTPITSTQHTTTSTSPPVTSTATTSPAPSTTTTMRTSPKTLKTTTPRKISTTKITTLPQTALTSKRDSTTRTTKMRKSTTPRTTQTPNSWPISKQTTQSSSSTAPTTRRPRNLYTGTTASITPFTSIVISTNKTIPGSCGHCGCQTIIINNNHYNYYYGAPGQSSYEHRAPEWDHAELEQDSRSSRSLETGGTILSDETKSISKIQTTAENKEKAAKENRRHKRRIGAKIRLENDGSGIRRRYSTRHFAVKNLAKASGAGDIHVYRVLKTQGTARKNLVQNLRKRQQQVFRVSSIIGPKASSRQTSWRFVPKWKIDDLKQRGFNITYGKIEKRRVTSKNRKRDKTTPPPQITTVIPILNGNGLKRSGRKRKPTKLRFIAQRSAQKPQRPRGRGARLNKTTDYHLKDLDLGMENRLSMRYYGPASQHMVKHTVSM